MAGIGINNIMTIAVVLFTLQLHLILQEAPTAQGLLLLWSLLFLYLLLKKKVLPLDHPLYHISVFQRHLTLLSLLLLLLTNLYFSYFVSQINQQKAFAAYLLQKEVSSQNIKAMSLTDAYADGNYIRIDLRIQELNEIPLSEKWNRLVVRLQVYANSEDELEDWRAIRRGDIWKGSLELVEPPLPRNPGGFNYREHLLQQRIYLIGTPDPHYELEPAATHSKAPFVKWRQAFANVSEGWETLVQKTFSSEISAIVIAMTIANRDQLDPEFLELYQELGVVHLLAISGLHVGILTFGLFRLLLFLRLTRENAYIFLLFFLPFYMTLCGFTISVVRSGLMCMLGVVLLIYGWQKRALLIFYLVYVSLLLFDPYWLYGIGFQLSFAVTFLLLTGFQPLDRLLSRVKLPKWLIDSMNITFLAQLASLPFLLYHFYFFSPYSFLTNLLIVPVFSFVLIPGAFLLPLLYSLFGKALVSLLLVYEKIFNMTDWLLAWINSLPLALLSTGKPPSWFFICYLFLVVLFLSACEKARVVRSSVYFLCISLLICFLILLPQTKQYALVTLLDVGQGDSIVIELPYRREVYLIDVGGTIQLPQPEWKQRKKPYEAGRDVVLQYLRYRGINQVDMIFFSHGHLDHFAGLQGLIGKVKIDKIYRSPVEPFNAFETYLLQAVHQQGTEVYVTAAGEAFIGKHHQTLIIYPMNEINLAQLAQVSSAEAHKYNLVIWQQIYNTALLWTGDLDQQGEQEILLAYPDLQTTILKVGHHGSNTSTSTPFLKQLNPTVALIPVGRNNRYGHPHPDVLHRLEQEQIAIMRTDQYGAIQIYIYPTQLKLRATLLLDGEPIK